MGSDLPRYKTNNTRTRRYVPSGSSVSEATDGMAFPKNIPDALLPNVAGDLSFDGKGG